MKRAPTFNVLAMLGGLYFSQGAPMGFLSDGLPVLLRAEGFSLSKIALAQILALPWLLKPLWAPVMDRTAPGRLGRRKRWILPLQAVGVLNLLILAQFDLSGSTMLVFGLLFLGAVLAATQDVATDGLAVSLLTPGIRGIGNGIQVAAYKVGMIVGGGGSLIAIDTLGWSWSFRAMALTLVAVTVPVLLLPETGQPSHRGDPVTSRELIDFLRGQGIRRWLILVLAYKATDVFGTRAIGPMLHDLGMSLTEIGVVKNMVGPLASIAGAMLGGWAVGRIGSRVAFGVFGAMQAVAMGLYILPAIGFTSRVLIGTLSCLEDFASSMVTATLFAAMMAHSRERTGSTDFTIQATLLVLAYALGGIAGPPVAQVMGYPLHLALAMVVALILVVFVVLSLEDPATVEKLEAD